MKTAFVTIGTAVVTQVFGNYNPALYGGDGRHKGIDYGVPVGTPVYACLPGMVTTAVTGETGYGRHIRITHEDGSLSIYGHLSKFNVGVGQVVEAGVEIGRSGGDPNDGIDGDGNTTGAHLHWEIRPAGALLSDQGAVNPMKYCSKFLADPVKKVGEVTSVSGLNVRAKAVNGQVLMTLKLKEVVDILEVVDGWARLRSTRPEWCSMQYVMVTQELNGVIVSGPSLEEKVERLWAGHLELH